MELKKLTDDGLSKLLCDIIDNKAEQRAYSFKKYKIIIGSVKNMSNVERVRKHYRLHPEKLKERDKKRRILYRKRKKQGICVRCGHIGTQDGSIACTRCNNRKKVLERSVRKSK